MNKVTCGFLLALSFFTQNTLATDTDNIITLAAANTGDSLRWTPTLSQKEMNQKEQFSQKIQLNTESMNKAIELNMEKRIAAMMQQSIEQ